MSFFHWGAFFPPSPPKVVCMDLSPFIRQQVIDGHYHPPFRGQGMPFLLPSGLKIFVPFSEQDKITVAKKKLRRSVMYNVPLHGKELWPVATFWTLTYDPEFYSVDEMSPFSDFRVFMNRLRMYYKRHAFDVRKLVYFACAEEGREHSRLHIHFCCNTLRLSQRLLSKFWGLGGVYVKRVREKMVYDKKTGVFKESSLLAGISAYMTKYITKDVPNSEDMEYHVSRVNGRCLSFSRHFLPVPKSGAMLCFSSSALHVVDPDDKFNTEKYIEDIQVSDIVSFNLQAQSKIENVDYLLEVQRKLEALRLEASRYIRECWRRAREGLIDNQIIWREIIDCAYRDMDFKNLPITEIIDAYGVRGFQKLCFMKELRRLYPIFVKSGRDLANKLGRLGYFNVNVGYQVIDNLRGFK